MNIHLHGIWNGEVAVGQLCSTMFIKKNCVMQSRVGWHPTRVYLSISTHVYIVWGQKPTFMKLQDQLIHSLGCKQGLLATTCESQVVTDWNDRSIGDLRTNCCFVIRKEILISKLVAACFQLSVYGLNVKLERDVVCGNILPNLYSKC